MPVEGSEWAVRFGLLIISCGALRSAIWLVNRFRSGPSHSGERLKLPLSFAPKWTDCWLLFGLCGLTLLLVPFLVPVVGLLAGILILVRRGVPVNDLWQLRWLETGRYLKEGFSLYLLIIVPLSALAALSMVLVRFVGVEPTAQPLIEVFLELEDPWQVIQIVFLAVVIAPVWEEVFFRGICYPLFRGVRDRAFGLVATSLLFGLAHGHGPSLVPLTFLGLVLAVVYERTGKLGICIALHAVFNLGTATTLCLVKYAP